MKHATRILPCFASKYNGMTSQIIAIMYMKQFCSSAMRRLICTGEDFWLALKNFPKNE